MSLLSSIPNVGARVVIGMDLHKRSVTIEVMAGDETVLARVFCTGQGRKTDATDAHSVALVGTRMAGLRPVVNDQQLAVLRTLADRRRSLGEDHCHFAQ